MIQAMALKIAALSLLVLIGQNPQLPDDFKAQALAVATQAMTVADQTLNAPLPSESSSNSPSPATPTSPAPAANTPVTNNTPTPMTSLARIEIISPIPGKGLTREHTAAPEVIDEANYMEIGAIVYDAAGNPTNQPTVNVTATDSSQNKEIKGTGVVATIYRDENKLVVPVYMFHYEFKTAGEHTITFKNGSLTESVVTIAN